MNHKVKTLTCCLTAFLVFSGCEFFSKKNPPSSTESPKVPVETPETSTPKSTEPAQALNAPTSSTPRKLSCICQCVTEINGKPTPICAHFSRVDSGSGDPKFECDAVFQVISELENCEATQKSTTFATCTGFHPETKAGGLKGQLNACHPG